VVAPGPSVSFWGDRLKHQRLLSVGSVVFEFLLVVIVVVVGNRLYGTVGLHRLTSVVFRRLHRWSPVCFAARRRWRRRRRRKWRRQGRGKGGMGAPPEGVE
jgi:hypothetical protein